MEQAATRRVGMVAVIGRPNVGKSTLVNALVGERVSITSRKPQTTRDRVLGVRTDADAQYIFVDTPGFQRRHRSALNKRMNERVTGALADVDAVVLVIEATGWRSEDEAVVQLLPADSDRVILAINKTDMVVEREKLLPLMADSMKRFPFRAIVPVSAEKKRQLDDLLKEIAVLLPEGVPLFDADQYTDRSVRFLAAEQIREKAYRLLGDELPYGVAVTIDRWIETDQGAEIVATLVVDREAHKPIVIGKEGAKLREISRLARADIIELLGKRVHLEVWVRVKKGWSDDARALRSLGYE
jgi:GTP-binding protein Era